MKLSILSFIEKYLFIIKIGQKSVFLGHEVHIPIWLDGIVYSYLGVLTNIKSHLKIQNISLRFYQKIHVQDENGPKIHIS
jgi:hypothetical protein